MIPFTYFTMNNNVLFPNSPNLVAFEQAQSSGKRMSSTSTKRTAHGRRRRSKRQSTTGGNIVTVVLDGCEHHVKPSAVKQQGTAKFLTSTSTNKGIDKKNKRRKSETKRVKKSENQVNSQQMKKKSNEKKSHNAKHREGMLTEERAYQLSIHPEEPTRDDISCDDMERRQYMLDNLEWITRILSLQSHVLPEERAYQRMIQPKEISKRHQVIKDLAAMKKLVNQGILPGEDTFQQFMNEAALYSAHISVLQD